MKLGQEKGCSHTSKRQKLFFFFFFNYGLGKTTCRLGRHSFIGAKHSPCKRQVVFSLKSKTTSFASPPSPVCFTIPDPDPSESTRLKRPFSAAISVDLGTDLLQIQFLMDSWPHFDQKQSKTNLRKSNMYDHFNSRKNDPTYM